LVLTTVAVVRAFWLSGASLARHSEALAEERKDRQPERRDGARRAWRQIRFLPLISTFALMKALHQKKSGFSASVTLTHHTSQELIL
jgi:hypothetical protein